MRTCSGKSKKASGTQSLFAFGFGRRNKAADVCKPKAKELKDVEIQVHQKATLKVPCPGLTEADDGRIPPYLYRTSALSGGGQSIMAIAKEHFGRSFRDLIAEEKDKGVDVQRLGHKWTVKLKSFKSALNHRVKDDTTYIFTPKSYRDPVLGQIYARDARSVRQFR